MRRLDSFKTLPGYMNGQHHQVLVNDRAIATAPSRRVGAQFELDDGPYLLLLENGTADGDDLAVVCLAPDLTVRASIPVPRADAPAVLSDVRPLARRRLSFCFGRKPWILDVAEGGPARAFGRRWLHVQESSARPKAA